MRSRPIDSPNGKNPRRENPGSIHDINDEKHDNISMNPDFCHPSLRQPLASRTRSSFHERTPGSNTRGSRVDGTRSGAELFGVRELAPAFLGRSKLPHSKVGNPSVNRSKGCDLVMFGSMTGRNVRLRFLNSDRRSRVFGAGRNA